MKIIQYQSEVIETAVQKLQEYRSALITNAVTGKIDVRNFRLPAEASAQAGLPEAEELVKHG